jgi:hypothetical protein
MEVTVGLEPTFAALQAAASSASASPPNLYALVFTYKTENPPASNSGGGSQSLETERQTSGSASPRQTRQARNTDRCRISRSFGNRSSSTTEYTPSLAARKLRKERKRKPELSCNSGLGQICYSCLLFRLGNDADVRLRRLPAIRILLFCIFVRYGSGNNHVLAAFPVHRRRNRMLRRQLQ